MPVEGQRCPETGKVTVGLASRWPCVTDLSDLPTQLRAQGLSKGDEHPHPTNTPHGVWIFFRSPSVPRAVSCGQPRISAMVFACRCNWSGTCSHSSPFFSRPSARRRLFRFALAICFDTLRGINSRVIGPSAHVRRWCGRAPRGRGHRVADPTRIPDRPPIRPRGCRMQPRDAGRMPSRRRNATPRKPPRSASDSR